MKIAASLLVTTVSALVVANGARAEVANRTTIVRNLDNVAWSTAPSSLPKGTQIVLLNGDPSKAGPFVLRLKFRPNTLIGAHRHATAENVTVLRGEFYHSVGERVDRSHGERVSAGGFVYLPGKTPHALWTTSAETVVQVTGTGPFGLLYVDPKEDPSKAK